MKEQIVRIANQYNQYIQYVFPFRILFYVRNMSKFIFIDANLFMVGNCSYFSSNFFHVLRAVIYDLNITGGVNKLKPFSFLPVY